MKDLEAFNLSLYEPTVCLLLTRTDTVHRGYFVVTNYSNNLHYGSENRLHLSKSNMFFETRCLKWRV